LLTEVGKEQALNLGDKLKSKGITTIYSSPLLRAVQTANIVASKNLVETPIVILKNLRECSFGDLEGLTFDEVERDYGTKVKDFLWPTRETWKFKFPNGESKKEAFERMKEALMYIVSVNKGCPLPVGVVCHAGVISAFACGMGLDGVSYENCSVLHLAYDYNERKFLHIKD
jgi:broad specificity phosphatase PhoE